MEKENTTMQANTDSVSNLNEEEAPRYISETEMEHLTAIVKWTKLVSIVMYVSCGFLLISSLFFFAYGDAWQGFCYIAGSSIALVPTTYLYKASIAYNSVIKNSDDSELDNALSNSAKYWKFVGIYTIICIVIVSVVIALALAKMAFNTI